MDSGQSPSTSSSLSLRLTPSPHKYHRRLDGDGGEEGDGSSSSTDKFDIPPKNASIGSLRRWRQSALVLNSSRRFRYTLDLKKAAILRNEARENEAQVLPAGSYGIGMEQLTSMTRDHDFSALQQYGGVKGVANMLKTNLDEGITGDDADISHRKSVFGANTYPQKKGRSFWVLLWEACQDLTLIILMIAAVLSLVLGIMTEGIKEGWIDGGNIIFAVVLVILVTAASDYRQSLQFQILNEEKRNIHLEVIRGGRRVEVSIFDFVVGDIVPLKIGYQVPADGILISGHSLAIYKSSMAGESKIVLKDQKSPFLISGCKVADGYGTMLVTAVGANPEWGLQMASISEDIGEETPLQVRLNGVATLSGIAGLAVAGVVLVVLLIRYFTGHSRNLDGTIQFVKGETSMKQAINGVVNILTVAVTVVVVAVPEGLPLAVTIALAHSMRKMLRDKALVRRLSACETMGSATTICSDITGTLTLNQMTVLKAYVGGKKVAPPENVDLLSTTAHSLLIEGVAQNTTGSVFEPKDGGAIEVTGSPTERAILCWGVKLGMKFADARSKSSILHIFPFSSEKRRGGVAIDVGGSKVRIHWKGDAETVLASCTGWLNVYSLEQKMTPNGMEKFKKCIEDMTAASLRCVAFAYRSYDSKEVPREGDSVNWTLPENDLILLAIVGMEDPCRPGVREAVRLCNTAGTKVRMVTGDNLQAAKAIALVCGILDSEADALEPTLIEGKTFRALSEKERDAVADKISVMGRSSPNDKLLLVQSLKRRGHVVAVTGDGSSDAPAFHEADIGLSMGIQGTEVAKESSDIIILDDSFVSVVQVVRWGRSVYANIQKFIQFQLTVIVAAIAINVVAAVSSGVVPLTTVQLLWVNLIMDTFGALALATEPPVDHLMKRPPVGRREPFITNIMWRNMFIQVIYQVTVLLVFNFAGTSILQLKSETRQHAEEVKNTVIFNTFVFCQVFNEFNCRKPDELNFLSGVTKNHLLMGTMGVTVYYQILVIGFLGGFFTTVRLGWQMWLISLFIAFLSWPIAHVGKLIPVPKMPLQEYCSRWCCRKQKGDEEDVERRGDSAV